MGGLAPSGFLQEGAEGLGQVCGQHWNRRERIPVWGLQRAAVQKGRAHLCSTEARLVRVEVNDMRRQEAVSVGGSESLNLLGRLAERSRRHHPLAPGTTVKFLSKSVSLKEIAVLGR